MRFAQLFLLGLLLLIPIFHQVWRRRNQPARVRFSLPIPKNVRRMNPTQILLFLRYAAMAFMIVALARPQESYRQTQRQVSGVDLMMVLDLSRFDEYRRPRRRVASSDCEADDGEFY